MNRCGLLALYLTGFAAVAAQSPAPEQNEASRAIAPQLTPARTVRQKWHHFVDETITPLTLVGGAFNASVSQVLNNDPRYGVGSGAYAQRFGASVADIASQNFFGDFVMASALHEDPRYIRRGPQYGFWNRVGYAIGRAVIIRKDSGGETFNWSNVTGTALSVGLSEAYYPPPSRTGGAMALRFGTNVAGAGFANLLPEFLPDFEQWLKRKFH